jgi:hypothetical protein
VGQDPQRVVVKSHWFLHFLHCFTVVARSISKLCIIVANKINKMRSPNTKI